MPVRGASLFCAAFAVFISAQSLAKPFPDCVVEDGVKICRDAHSDTRDVSASSFDLYLPGSPVQNQTFRPIMMIHGGCFNGGDKRDLAPVAKRFAREGFAVLALNYTLATDHESSYSDVIGDLKTHMHWLVSDQAKTLKIQPDWIGAYGESSGGTLVSYLGTRHLNADRPLHQAAVDSVVDFYGRIDFTRPQPAGKGVDCAVTFLNASRATDLTRFQEASVQPTLDIPPAHFFIAHGSADPQVEPWHSKHLQQELRSIGVPDTESQLLLLPNQGHGFLGSSLQTALSRASSFFNSESAQHNPPITQIFFKKNSGH